MKLKTFLLSAVLLITGICYLATHSAGRTLASREAIELSLNGSVPISDTSGTEEEHFQCIDRIGECGTSCPQLNKYKLCKKDTKACPDPELSIKLICR